MRRRRLLLVLLLPCLYSANTPAQQDSTIVMKSDLHEIVIESKRVTHYTDHDVYLPSEQQKKHAANGLDLLSIVRLPRIRVDQVEKTISSMAAGGVQIRINNIESTIEDLQALTPEQITKIDYITQPGLRYGSDIAAVINIKVKRNDTGMAWGVNTMNAVTTNYNDDSGWMKLTGHQSEFGLRYNFKLNSNEDVKTNSHQRFADNNGGTRYIDKEGTYNDSRYTNHDVTLTFNTTNSKSRVFDVKLSMDWSRFPNRTLTEAVTDGNELYSMTTSNKSNEKTPMLKLYYADDLGHNNFFSAYVATAYVNSSYGRGFRTAQTVNEYDVKGNKYSAKGELNFSHKFKSGGELNIGYQQSGAYTENSYTAENNLESAFHNDAQYLFAEYKTNIKNIGINLGLGGSRDYSSDGDNHYTFWAFRPNVNISCQANNKLAMAYKYSRDTTVPTLSQLTDFTRYDNAYEATMGNPNLKPYITDINELSMGYDLGKTYLSLIADYNYSHHIICDNEVTVSDGVYQYTTGNEANRHHLQISMYAEQYLMNKKLFIYLMPYLTRDIMTGAYIHTNTYWSVKTGCSLFIGKFAIDFDFDSASEYLTGETIYHDLAKTNLSLTYKHNNLSVKGGIRNMLMAHGTGNRTERLSDTAYSWNETRNHAFGNMVYLSLSWNMSKGKAHKQLPVKMSNSSLDSGIVK